MELSINTAKNIHDTDGSWYMDTFEELRNYISTIKYGRKTTRYYNFENKEYSSFRQQSRNWFEKTNNAAFYGYLWETGILIESENNNISVISLSVPWDESNVSWFKRLTPEKFFIGREYELDMISYYITGKSFKHNQLEKTFNADDITIWWGELMKHNKVLKGRYEEIRSQIGTTFSERVIKKLKTSIPSKRMYDLITQAKRISGYVATVNKDELSGSIKTKLSIDSVNWIEVFPEKEQINNSETPGSYDYLRKNKPPDEKMWIYRAGFLWNDPKSIEHNNFSVFIKLLDQESQAITGNYVSDIYISRIIKLREGLGRAYHYYIDNEKFGDSLVKSNRALVGNKKDFLPLNEKDWKLIVDMFNKSLERGVVDSTTYWTKHLLEGLDSKTQTILKEASELIEKKVKKYSSNNFNLSG